MVARLTDEEAAATLAAAGLEALEPYPGAAAPWRCRCLTCGTTVSPRLNNVRSGQSSGCRVCAHRQVRQSTQLSAEDGLAALTAAGLEALEPYPGSRTPWRCLCLTCGAVVTPQLKTIRRGGGCRACGHAKTGAANRTDAGIAVVTMRKHGFEPLMPYPGGGTPWRCRCLICGMECTPRLLVVLRGKSRGCSTCAFRRMGDARTMPADVAATRMRDRGYEPLGPYPGLAGRPWRCLHVPCGNEVTPTLNTITNGYGGCRDCAAYGFKVNKPAWVYLVARSTDSVRQYGITNDPTTRLAAHARAGFTVVVELLACADGHLALAIEGSIRAHLQTLSAGPACRRNEFNGWTETFAAAAAPDLRPSDFAPALGC